MSGLFLDFFCIFLYAGSCYQGKWAIAFFYRFG